MLRVLLAALAGGFVLFFWGFLSWTVLHLHTPSIRPVPDEPALAAALTEHIPEAGLYWIPNMPEHDPQATREERAAAMDAWVESHRDGPVAVLNVHPGGLAPMHWTTFATGVGLNFIACLIAGSLLWPAVPVLRQYAARVVFIAALGIFLGVAGHLSLWNWLHFAADHTAMMVLDEVIGWTLVGLAMAAIIRPRAEAAAGQ